MQPQQLREGPQTGKDHISEHRKTQSEGVIANDVFGDSYFYYFGSGIHSSFPDKSAYISMWKIKLEGAPNAFLKHSFSQAAAC